MKSTDLARRDREIRRAQKKNIVQERKSSRESRSIGDYINDFVDQFFFDANKIYNIESDEILLLLEEMKDEMPSKQWSNIIMKAVKKTKVKQRDEAVEALTSLGELDQSPQE